jgi:hypothetical protein
MIAAGVGRGGRREKQVGKWKKEGERETDEIAGIGSKVEEVGQRGGGWRELRRREGERERGRWRQEEEGGGQWRRKNDDDWTPKKHNLILSLGAKNKFSDFLSFSESSPRGRAPRNSLIIPKSGQILKNPFLSFI